MATWLESWSLSCSRALSSSRIFPLGIAKSTSYFPSRHVFKQEFSFPTSELLLSTASSSMARSWMGKWGNSSLITAMKATAPIAGAQSRLSSGILRRKGHKTRKRENPRGWTSAGAYLLCREGIPDRRLQGESSWSDIFWRSRRLSWSNFSFSAVIWAISTFPLGWWRKKEQPPVTFDSSLSSTNLGVFPRDHH